MLSDRFFFPLSILLAIAMVGLALVPAWGRLPDGPVSGGGKNYQKIIVDGVDLNRVRSPGRDDHALVREGERTWLVVNGATEELGRANDGPYIPLAADIEKQFGGREIQISVRARASAPATSAVMELNYEADAEHTSGWIVFSLGDTYQTQAFTFTPPPPSDALGLDFLGIRGLGAAAIEIDQIVFERQS
ncbi:MAG: hypothetical protein AAFQ67_02830 [Pseudomonadota bacterium]